MTHSRPESRVSFHYRIETGKAPGVVTSIIIKILRMTSGGEKIWLPGKNIAPCSQGDRPRVGDEGRYGIEITLSE